MAEPIALQVKPPAPMSLGDMLNIARGAQSYQQEQQLNPLALQKAQMEVEQLQKTNPLAVREKTAQAIAAETGATKGKAELNAYYKDQARKTYGGLLTDPDFNPLKPNPEGMKVKLQEAGDYLTNVLGVPEHESKAQQKLFEHIEKHGVVGAQRVIQQIANGVQQSGTSSEQFAQANRPPSAIATGKETILYPTSRYQAGQPSSVFRQELSPESRKSVTQLDPLSGDTIVYDIDENGKPTNVRFLKAQQPQEGAPNAPLAPPPVPQAVAPGATAETERAKATTAINTYLGANKALTDASVAGHIPTQEMVAKKLLTYLKDESVKTGPIADVLAGKTNQATLTSKEQEVLKLIQQRIQNLNPRTDADAQSKKDAYGSFRLKKDALVDLIRQDMGNIANQKLLAQGIMNAAGDAKNPNLPAVNSFQNKYREFSQNPALMQYIGIVGTSSKANIDKEDEKALKRLFEDNKLGKNEIATLEAQRKELVKLTGGQ